MKKYITVIIVSVTIIQAELTYFPISGDNSFWCADSYYYGLGLVAKNPSKPVTVIKTRYAEAMATGQLYFMVPVKKDSALYLFDNVIDSTLQEQDTVNLGKFPVGTKIIFMYMITDTSNLFNDMKNIKLYSGQNRTGFDQYISERKGLVDFRWAITGIANDSTCEMDFAAVVKASFKEIKFLITNVYREEMDKYKVATPEASPDSEYYSGTIHVNLSSASVGEPVIYYTLDGTVPNTRSHVYKDPIEINKTTTIKTFASMTGDTQWIDSDILTKNYVIDVTKSKMPKGKSLSLKKIPATNKVYNFQGRVINYVNSKTLIDGIYIIINGNQCKKTFYSSIKF
ncbi:MAG: hypothetical protein GX660_16965 [Clostridiaceae bacterium]|nr:hypothetical protein [Clostridiaceae bacterium]